MPTELDLAAIQVSRKLSIPRSLVKQIYKSYWQFIKTYLSELSLEDIDESDSSSQATNFNITYIGKLYTTEKRIKKKKEQLKLNQDAENKINQADRQSDISK